MYFLIAGKTGCGKTVTMTRIVALRAVREKNIFGKPLDVYANYHIKRLGKQFHYLESPRTVDQVKLGMLCGDDFWQWLDSRLSQTKRNIKFNNVLANARKRGLDVYITSQDYWAIDRRVRLNADILIKPARIPNTDYCYVVGLDAQDFNSGIVRPYFEYAYDMTKIFPLYDTEEEIKSGYDDQTQFSDIKEYGEMCITWLIGQGVRRPSKAQVRVWSYKMNEDQLIEGVLDTKTIEDIHAYVKTNMTFHLSGKSVSGGKVIKADMGWLRNEN